MTESDATRRCEECERPLPASARPNRRFCSSRCRYRSWDDANRFDEPHEAPYPLHWHWGHVSPTTGEFSGVTILTGYQTAGYWREDGCPPGCPGVDPRGWSIGIPHGKEGLSPDRDWFRAPLRAVH